MKKLSEKFKDEREAICDKIIGILELTNGEFILCELDENTEKQQRLLELKPEIMKYFECSSISTFKPLKKILFIREKKELHEYKSLQSRLLS